MTELWKDIKGYEGYYQVSNLGNVRSLEREIIKGDTFQVRKAKIKTQWLSPDGYPQVKLSKENKDKNISVHILVAEAFIPKKDDHQVYEVNHKDANRANNNVDNLEWVTHKENIKYAAQLGHMKHYGKDNPNYGNKTLKKKFEEHPELKMLLARKGKQNGRAVPIIIRDTRTGMTKEFGYIREAAQYFIDNRITLRDKVPTVNYLGNILKEYMTKGKLYCGYEIKYA